MQAPNWKGLVRIKWDEAGKAVSTEHPARRDAQGPFTDQRVWVAPPQRYLGDQNSCPKQQGYVLDSVLFAASGRTSRQRTFWKVPQSSSSLCREVNFWTIPSELVHRRENFGSKSCKKFWGPFQSNVFSVGWGEGDPRPIHPLCPQVGHRSVGLGHPAKP